MKTLDELPVQMRQPVVTREDAEAFIKSLYGQGLGYHFDDGAVDCLQRNGLADEGTAMWIDTQIDLCYKAWVAGGADLYHDCPIGFLLKVEEEAGDLPEGFSL